MSAALLALVWRRHPNRSPSANKNNNNHKQHPRNRHEAPSQEEDIQNGTDGLENNRPSVSSVLTPAAAAAVVQDEAPPALVESHSSSLEDQYYNHTTTTNTTTTGTATTTTTVEKEDAAAVDTLHSVDDDDGENTGFAFGTHNNNHSNPTTTTLAAGVRSMVVVTPDGLKPRRSVADVRDELLLAFGGMTKNMEDDIELDSSFHRSHKILVTHANREKNSTTLAAKVNDDAPENRGTASPKTTTKTTSSATTASNTTALVALAPPVALHQQQQSLWRPSPTLGTQPDSFTVLQEALVPPPVRATQTQLAVLPPFPIRSWSTTTTTQDNKDEQTRSVWSSPTPATSYNSSASTGTGTRASIVSSLGFFGQSRFRPTGTPAAESPHLIPGRTRTAVGQWLASAGTSIAPPQPTTTTTATFHTDEWPIMSPQEQSVDSMYSPLTSKSAAPILLLLPPPTTAIPWPCINSKRTGDNDEWPIMSPQEQSVDSMYSPLSKSSRPSIKQQPNASLESNKKNNGLGIGFSDGVGGLPPLQNTKESNDQHQQQASTMFSPLVSTTQSSSSSHATTTPMTMANYSNPSAVSSLSTFRMMDQRPSPLIRSSQQHKQYRSDNNNNNSVLPPSAMTIVPHRSSSTAIHGLIGTTTTTTTQRKQVAGYSWKVTTTDNISNHINQGSSGSIGDSCCSGSSCSMTSKRIIQVIGPGTSASTTNINNIASSSSLQDSKRRIQQRKKEDLIFAALERLQDDPELVKDVEGLVLFGTDLAMAKSSAPLSHDTNEWFVRTPLNQEGILIGFFEHKRYDLIEKLDILLKEIKQSRNVHFAQSSTTMEPTAQKNFRRALHFCKVLIQMAIPSSEREDSSLQGTDDGMGKWTFLHGLRQAIGVATTTPVETPRPRGGDSSFFSLPENECETTPMTSNVSIGASTLTTWINPNNTNNILGNMMTSPRARVDHDLKLKAQNGLHLRQAIQILSTGLQKLTLACLPLLELDLINIEETLSSRKVSRIVDSLQEAYLELLSMSQNDLKSIVDAFEFEQVEDDCFVVNVESTEDADGKDENDNYQNDPPPKTEIMEMVQQSPIVNASTLCLGNLPPPCLSNESNASTVTHENEDQRRDPDNSVEEEDVSVIVGLCPKNSHGCRETAALSVAESQCMPQRLLWRRRRRRRPFVGVIEIPNDLEKNDKAAATNDNNGLVLLSSRSVASSTRSLTGILERIDRLEV